MIGKVVIKRVIKSYCNVINEVHEQGMSLDDFSDDDIIELINNKLNGDKK